jgi:hypothetical protein
MDEFRRILRIKPSQKFHKWVMVHNSRGLLIYFEGDSQKFLFLYSVDKV